MFLVLEMQLFFFFGSTIVSRTANSLVLVSTGACGGSKTHFEAAFVFAGVDLYITAG